MSVLDFVFGGKPAPNNPAQGGTASIPQYMSDASMQIVNKANGLYNNETYQPYDGPRVAGATPQQQQSWDTVGQTAGTYQPAVNSALQKTEAIAGTANGGYTNAANTVKGGLGRFTGDTVDSYMNPYLKNVTDRSTELAMRNWNEQMLPGLNSQFVGSGQFGSSPNAAVAYRGARDVTDSIQSQANAELAAGYDTAQGAFSNDQNRQLTGGMDQASIAGQRANTGLEAANQQANLAQTAQGMGYKDASALDAAGQEQRGINQQGYDTRYGDFVDQRDYQKNQLNDYEHVIAGLPGQSQSSTYVGPGQVGASPAALAGGVAAGMAGLWPNTNPNTPPPNTPVQGQGQNQMARGGLIDSKPKRDIPGWLREAMLELMDKHVAA